MTGRKVSACAPQFMPMQNNNKNLGASSAFPVKDVNGRLSMAKQEHKECVLDRRALTISTSALGPIDDFESELFARQELEKIGPDLAPIL
ncbi:unnamed protein product [Sphenostylis stenocarpa]|uniref:Uncharacterized protein n=1 Tax=Sphenostylis stenocarpa TaxID=92480 RepID=A0AA86RX23_9FABA|nr:unnamed protein product [Sphenostylis stenocarpa]